MEFDKPDSPTGGEDVAPAEGGGNDPAVADFFEVANDLLGTQFKDNDSAQKYIKDNIAFVNEARQIHKNASAIDASKFVPREQYENDTFFNSNPEFASGPIRKVIESLRTTTGKPLQEVVQMDEFKGVYGKYKVGDEHEKSTSVIHSNPRIGIAVDKISQAKEAIKAGNVPAAEAAAVDAVLENIAAQEGN